MEQCAQSPPPGLPLTVRGRLWPHVSGLILFCAGTFGAIWLAFTLAQLWLVAAAGLAGAITVVIGAGLRTRPITFSFARDEITVRTLAGSRRWSSHRLDDIVALSASSLPRIVLVLSDGGRLVIREEQIHGTVADLAARLERHLRPLIVPSPWSRTQDRTIPPKAFGPGSDRPFSAYLEGASTVTVSSIEDILAWLRGCEAIPDRELFGTGDLWQHPQDFEQLRRGDCEDHALWAWRKLLELDVDAELVVGSWDGAPHAWVTFIRDCRRYLLEASTKDDRMVWAADEVRDAYRPRFSVNRHLVTYRYREARAGDARAGRRGGA